MRLTGYLLCALTTMTLVGLDARSCFAQSLQESLDDLEVGDRWEYDEWESAQAAAVASGKPILALFR